MSKDNKVSTLTKATVKAITEIATAQAIKAYNDEKNLMYRNIMIDVIKIQSYC